MGKVRVPRGKAEEFFRRLEEEGIPYVVLRGQEQARALIRQENNEQGGGE